ncbi:MAG: gamma-glutamyltransferase, partial [Candidatus Bathyarchaeia archaeon]
MPHLSGLGGDFFALIMDPNGRVHFLNGSGYAPRRLTLDFMRKLGFSSMPSHGVYSISVPGMVDGLHKLWRRFGSLEWGRLILPAIKIAHGFPATKSLCEAVKHLKDELMKDRGSRETYLVVDNARIAYSIRDKYVTDARFMDLKAHRLLSDDFIKSMKSGMLRADGKNLSGGDTTFFAVADDEGWLVAAIQSIFHSFGSYITEPRFNITLNSRASSFSLDKD